MAYRTIQIKPSSNILSIRYDDETKDLLVVFVRDMRQYQVHGVDSKTAESASRAESVGRWYNMTIRGQYAYEEV